MRTATQPHRIGILFVLICLLFLPRAARADEIGSCPIAGTVGSVAGTSCAIGPLEFTFGAAPAGFSGVSFAIEISPLAGGAAAVGFQLGAATMAAGESAQLNYTAAVLPGGNDFIAGDLFGITGAVADPPGSYQAGNGPDVASTMYICPPDAAGPPCMYAGASVNAAGFSSAATENLFAYPYGAQSSVNGFVDVACQGDGSVTCQTGAEQFQAVVQTPEPGAALMLLAGLVALAILRLLR